MDGGPGVHDSVLTRTSYVAACPPGGESSGGGVDKDGDRRGIEGRRGECGRDMDGEDGVLGTAG
eukprot:3009397-Alexandrium_andersonii.AAC.1